jgi:hypothetical protein
LTSGNRILGFTAFITGGGDLIAVVQTAMLSGMSQRHSTEWAGEGNCVFGH